MLPYLIMCLMGALWSWWEYRTLYPKPKRYIPCITGCGAELLPGIHFNSKVEGHELPNGEKACVSCYLKIWDEVDEAIGIPAPEREEPCIQATPETRKMVAKMTAKWPCAGDDLSNLDAEFEARLAEEKAEAVAREVDGDFFPTIRAPLGVCMWCSSSSVGSLCDACIASVRDVSDEQLMEGVVRGESGRHHW